MNLLFLTLSQFESINERGIYPDLLRKFAKNGHDVYAISPIEKRQGRKTSINRDGNVTVLRLRIGNTQKTHIIEKGISTVMIEPQYKNAIKKYFSDVKFDLVLYSTPPITLVGAIEYVKKRDNAKTYLMLKDIFPQNAIDIGMMSETGLKGILYRHFREQEKILYEISDRIGCMSRANVEYVLKHNPEVKRRNEDSLSKSGKAIVEICPNCIEPIDMSITDVERQELRCKYNVPQNKMVFVYGGNLGKPQGIPFMLECLDSQKDNDEVFFLIIGSGTEYHLIEEYININKPKNIALYNALPKEDYDKLVAACDVGMIFLDHRFTIPNFPSRLLSYMQAKIPVLAVTDPNTDIGVVISEGEFGWWSESSDTSRFEEIVYNVLFSNLTQMGENAFSFLENNYSSQNAYESIMELFK